MNFYAYRLPGELKIEIYSSERLKTPEEFNSSNVKSGFVISPFDNSDYQTVIIPADTRLDTIPDTVYGGYLDFFKGESTSEESYRAEFYHIIELLNNIQNKNGIEPKIVATRVKLIEGYFSPRIIFSKLCETAGDNFVFCFYTPVTGLWIGASPETLIRSKSSMLFTMSLAGTRMAGCSEDWDDKNKSEQRTVTDFITDTLIKEGLRVTSGKTYSKRSGTVEHICTPIYAEFLNSKSCSFSSILQISENLSPTPALSGFPRKESMKLINQYEEWPRAYYGGYCGPIKKSGDADLFVTLRCGCMIPGWIALYAGGGITRQSKEQSEWEETEKKFKTMLSAIER